MPCATQLYKFAPPTTRSAAAERARPNAAPRAVRSAEPDRLRLARPEPHQDLGAATVRDRAPSRTDRTSMRMPPFMRQSNAEPLTPANWQYDLLMRWVERRIERRALAARALAAPARAASFRRPRRGETRERAGPHRRCGGSAVMQAIRHRSARSRGALFKRFGSPAGAHVLIVPHSRIFDLPAELADRFDADARMSPRLLADARRDLGGESRLAWSQPAPQSMSLNVSSTCNLSCGYCYAERGGFGGAQPRSDDLRSRARRHRSTARGRRCGAPDNDRLSRRRAVRNRALIHRSCYCGRAGRATRARRALFRHHQRHDAPVPTSLCCATIRSPSRSASTAAQSLHDMQRPADERQPVASPRLRTVAPLLADPGLRAGRRARDGDACRSFDLKARLDASGARVRATSAFAPLRGRPTVAALP